MTQHLYKRQLPEHWDICTLDDVTIKISNGANVTQYDTEVGYPICRIETIWNEGIDLQRVKYIKETDKEFIKKYALQHGDILLSHINSDAHLGKTGLYKSQTKTLIHGVNTLLVRVAVAFSSDFLNYQLKLLKAEGLFIDSAQRSVNQSSINQKKLKSFQIVVAPLPEQHRIVAKIEELFSELDKGVESLKTARAQLKIYRQALLKNAFEGKLTADWRQKNQSKLESADALLKRIQTERAKHYAEQLAKWEASGKQGSKPKAPKALPALTADELAGLPELPQGWGWFKLADLSSVSGGLTKNQKREALLIKRPFLRVGNVYANRLELSDMHETGISEAEIERVTLVKNDILIVEGNGSVDQIGRVAIWNGAINGCVHQNHLIKARPLDIVCSEFILHFLMSELGRKFIVRSASSTSGLHTLSISKVESLFVPFCVIEEQKILLCELSSKLSFCDQLDQTIITALQQADALRQSILKKAFSGELVAQDPNDEPAAVLLARIKKEAK